MQNKSRGNYRDFSAWLWNELNIRIAIDVVWVDDLNLGSPFCQFCLLATAGGGGGILRGNTEA